jgi:hypothetical protein
VQTLSDRNEAEEEEQEAVGRKAEKARLMLPSQRQQSPLSDRLQFTGQDWSIGLIGW